LEDMKMTGACQHLRAREITLQDFAAALVYLIYTL
jgi:hypothetical protein